MEIRAGKLAFCAAALAPITALAQTPSFSLVGAYPTTATSTVNGLSADGSTAAGWSNSAAGSIGFVWTPQGGRHDFGLDPGMPASEQALAISGDGISVTGVMSGGHAYRWSGSAPPVDLGVLQGYTRSRGLGMSNDGSVVVGRVETGASHTFGQAFRWTETAGMQGLGYTQSNGVYSEATGISRDGTTIVGNSMDENGFNDAFVWRNGTMTALPQLPGTRPGESWAYASNVDGSVVAGASGSPVRATMWRNGLPVDLGSLPNGWGYSQGSAVDDSGSVVVGYGYPTQGLGNFATVWTPATGMEPLADYLTANGVSIPTGWTLGDCYAVSADGLTFGGGAYSTDGRGYGFVATIPTPSTLIALGLLTALRRRTRANF